MKIEELHVWDRYFFIDYPTNKVFEAHIEAIETKSCQGACVYFDCGCDCIKKTPEEVYATREEAEQALISLNKRNMSFESIVL